MHFRLGYQIRKIDRQIHTGKANPLSNRNILSSMYYILLLTPVRHPSNLCQVRWGLDGSTYVEGCFMECVLLFRAAFLGFNHVLHLREHPTKGRKLE